MRIQTEIKADVNGREFIPKLIFSLREREKQRGGFMWGTLAKDSNPHTLKTSSDVFMPFLDFKERKKSLAEGNLNLL